MNAKPTFTGWLFLFTDTLTDTLFCFRFLIRVFQNAIFVIEIRINAIFAHFSVIDSRFSCWFEPNRGSQKKAHRITGALFLLQSANDPVRSQPQEPAGCNKAKPIEQAKRRGAAVHCAGAERAQWAMQRGGGGAGNRAMCCGQKPAVQRDNFRARNGRWFEPGRGSRVGQGCALFKTSGSGRNVSHTAPPALLFPTKSCGAGFRGGPSFAHRVTGALFLFIGHKQCCTSALAKAAQAANIVTLQQVCDKVKRRRFAKRRRPPWNPRSKPNTSWPMP